MKTSICGIPVKIQYIPRENQTLIHPRTQPLKIYQRELIQRWLESRGNTVVTGNWTYIPVQGQIAPMTLLNIIEP
jgi:hypothetical protein